MLRIVHLSDIHLAATTLEDAEQFVIKALIDDLKTYNANKEIDAVIITGDLIDRGGGKFRRSFGCFPNI